MSPVIKISMLALSKLNELYDHNHAFLYTTLINECNDYLIKKNIYI